MLLFLGFLVPYSPDSLSTTPFHLPDPSAPALSSNSPQSSTATNSQVETTRKTAQSPLYTPSEAVKLAQEGVVGKANWLSERNKNVIYNWVGKKSVELQSKQGTHPAYSAMLETGSRSTMHNVQISLAFDLARDWRASFSSSPASFFALSFPSATRSAGWFSPEPLVFCSPFFFLDCLPFSIVPCTPHLLRLSTRLNCVVVNRLLSSESIHEPFWV